MDTDFEEHQRRLLAAALAEADLSVGDLWLKYFSIGGGVGEYETDAFLAGLFPLPELQRDLLAQAANELIDELPGRRRVPYSSDPAPGRGSGAGGRPSAGPGGNPGEPPGPVPGPGGDS